MKDKDIDLNTSGSLPESTEHMQGDGASKSDMKRGYSKSPLGTVDGGMLGTLHDDGSGDSVDSDRGFLNRPQGWER